MLKVPVIKPLTYISPSSFSVWQTCPFKLYMLRLAGFPYEPIKQNKAMLSGTLFDFFIKDHIAKQRKIDEPHLDLTHNISKLQIKDGVDIEEVLTEMREVARQYIALGFTKKFLDTEQLLIERELYRVVNNIPLLGIPDIIMGGIPFDFKIRGYDSTTYPSPTIGHIGGKESNGSPIAPHLKNSYLEKSKPQWAVQMFIYNLLLGNNNKLYLIDEILKTKTGFKVVTLRGSYTANFMETIMQELNKMWNNINHLNIQIPSPQASKYRCISYGRLCEIAHKCTVYRTTFGDSQITEALS